MIIDGCVFLYEAKDCSCCPFFAVKIEKFRGVFWLDLFKVFLEVLIFGCDDK
jgi:hypothetical protein